MADNNVLAIIPARGGSKRLPGKNIKLLDGRPLIAYSIMIAKAMDKVDYIVTTSDDQDTLDIATWWGSDTILRPSSLASDNHDIRKTCQHAIREYDIVTDWVVLLQPVCPIRSVMWRIETTIYCT